MDLIPPVDPVSIRITVNDQPFAAANWQFDPATHFLTFINEPEIGSSVQIGHRLADEELLSDFIMVAPASYLSATVTVNNEVADNATYDESTNTASFASPPQDDAVIGVTYLVAYDPILSYAHSLEADLLGYTLVARYEDSGEVVEVEADGTSFYLAEAGFRPDQAVVVDVVDASVATDRIVISEYVEPGTLVVENADELCVSGTIEVFDNGVDLTNCTINDLNAVIVLSYANQPEA